MTPERIRLLQRYVCGRSRCNLQAYMICNLHACMMHRLQIDTTLTCFRLSDSRDSGEDMKECGRGQSERHAKSWGGGGRKKEKGRALPLPSFLPIFLFFCFCLFCFIFFHVRAFSIQRTLLSRSLEHTKAEEGLPTSDFRSRGVATLTHGTHVRT